MLYSEDRPHSFVHDQIDGTVRTAPEPGWKSSFAAHYVQTYLGGTAPEAVKNGFAKGKPFYWVEPARPFPPLDLTALRDYKTQLGDWFKTPAAIASLYASRPERYWTRTPA